MRWQTSEQNRGCSRRIPAGRLHEAIVDKGEGRRGEDEGDGSGSVVRWNRKPAWMSMGRGWERTDI